MRSRVGTGCEGHGDDLVSGRTKPLVTNAAQVAKNTAEFKPLGAESSI